MAISQSRSNQSRNRLGCRWGESSASSIGGGFEWSRKPSTGHWSIRTCIYIPPKLHYYQYRSNRQMYDGNDGLSSGGTRIYGSPFLDYSSPRVGLAAREERQSLCVMIASSQKQSNLHQIYRRPTWIAVVGDTLSAEYARSVSHYPCSSETALPQCRGYQERGPSYHAMPTVNQGLPSRSKFDPL